MAFGQEWGCCGMLYEHSSSAVTATEIVSRECDSSKLLSSSGCLSLLFVMVVGMCVLGVAINSIAIFIFSKNSWVQVAIWRVSRVPQTRNLVLMTSR